MTNNKKPIFSNTSNYDSDKEQPKIFVFGSLLSEDFYNKKAEITPEDLDAIRKDWQASVPDDFINLLDAD